MPGDRKKIPAATEAALWALSNGFCYAPGCKSPVMVEVKKGVYRKNAQIAHIYGVRPGMVRHQDAMLDEERDSFGNLLLLCLPHHGEVDDKKTGALEYPPELLLDWKIRHEGKDARALAALGNVDEQLLGDLLAQAFTPPLDRLEAIARQLEDTGHLTAGTARELLRIVDVLRETPSLDRRTASMLMEAAETFGSSKLYRSASLLMQAAETLDVQKLEQVAKKLIQASEYR